MKKLTKTLLSAVMAAGIALGATACYSNTEYQDRKEQQQTTTLENSLEKANLKEKLERENDANAVRYVYLVNYGNIFGYYVIKGKVSSNGSQLAPEQEVIRYFGEPNILDSAQDDGTYGEGDPGIFFFLADGTMVTTSFDYLQSDNPLAIDVPRLGGAE